MTSSATSKQIYQGFIPLTGAPGIRSALTGGPLTSAEIYQTLQARGILGQRRIEPEDLAIHGIDPGPGYPLRVGFRVAEDTVNPYSQQGSFEIQRQIGSFALSAGYNYNRGIHLIRPLDLNIFQAGTNEAGRPIAGFRNPLILQDNVYGSWGRSYYHAMIVQLKKRFSRGFTISAHHTWSKHIDENTDYKFVLRTPLCSGTPATSWRRPIFTAATDSSRTPWHNLPSKRPRAAGSGTIC